MTDHRITYEGTPVQPRSRADYTTGGEFAAAMFDELARDDAENPNNRISIRIHGIIRRALTRANDGEFRA